MRMDCFPTEVSFPFPFSFSFSFFRTSQTGDQEIMSSMMLVRSSSSSIFIIFIHHPLFMLLASSSMLEMISFSLSLFFVEYPEKGISHETGAQVQGIIIIIMINDDVISFHGCNCVL